MSELQNVINKVSRNCTYTANYWAPLQNQFQDNEGDDGMSPQQTVNNLSDAEIQHDLRSTIRAWIKQRMSKHKPFQTTPSTMILDSGATSSFVRPEEKLPITGLSSKIVQLPDGSSIQTTHTALLPFESLSAEARKADVLPGLRPNSLISVGKFSDADYTTVFHPRGEGVTVHKKGTFHLKLHRQPILQGWRDANGLWRVSHEAIKQQPAEAPEQQVVSQDNKATIANVYSLPSIVKTIRYLHAAAGFPAKDTWIKAIKNGHYKTWPGLTVDAVSKYFPESIETPKGHLKKQRQNVRSTKQLLVEETSEDEELTRAVAKQNIMIKMVNASETIYTDQSGKLPVQSSKGNTSLMVMYDVDANAIDAEPIRSHHDSHMIPAYQRLWQRLNRGRVNKPKLHILDNEASEKFKTAIKGNCDLQLVPPDTHRRNLAERAIQTFKSHFISILAGVEPNFPMNLWDRLVPQAVVTLNLLRQSRKNPAILAYQHVNGVFDYNKTPLGPLGCAVEMHESANRRRTWDPRSLSGWYIGTSMEHYRCHKIFCKRTRSERISDTVIFQHRYITQPEITPEDTIVKAVGDLASALRQRTNAGGKEEMRVLQQMDILLNNRTEPQKRVTFEDPVQQTVPQPRVERTQGKRRQVPEESVSPPRVPLQEAPSPRVETTFSSRNASNLPQEAKTA
jgi:hypothetical protein